MLEIQQAIEKLKDCLIASDVPLDCDYDNCLILVMEQWNRKTDKCTYYYAKQTREQIDKHINYVSNFFAEVLQEEIEQGRFAV